MTWNSTRGTTDNGKPVATGKILDVGKIISPPVAGVLGSRLPLSRSFQAPLSCSIVANHSQPIYRYRLDEADVIVYVNHWWLAFAQENNATELDESSVVGHVLWEFIVDEPTRTLYKEIHKHVRSSGHPITVPFRCDSPTLQRYMQLTINNDGEGQLLCESRLIRAVPQRHIALLDSAQERSDSFLTMCSCCKRSLIEPSGWLEIENIALKLRLYEKQAVPGVRYTVCPSCANRFQHEGKQEHQTSG